MVSDFGCKHLQYKRSNTSVNIQALAYNLTCGDAVGCTVATVLANRPGASEALNRRLTG